MTHSNGSGTELTPTVNDDVDGGLSAECPEPGEYTSQKRFLRTTLYALAMTVSLLGNSVVICVVRRNRRMRNITHHLIVNMAVADLLITMLHMPFMLQVQITNRYDLVVGGLAGELICKAVGFSQDVSIACSVLSLMGIAIDRFIALWFPLKRASLLHRARYAVVPIWIVSVCICAPLLYANRMDVYEGKFYCYEDWSPLFNPTTATRDYTIVQFLLLYALPLIVILILYSCVVCKVWHRDIPGQVVFRRARQHSQAKTKLLRMLIIVVCLFAACWLPYHVVHFLTVFSEKHQVCGDSVIFYCLFIGQANSALNPCIYFVIHKEYRKGLCQILSLLCCCRDCKLTGRLALPFLSSFTLPAKADDLGLTVKPNPVPGSLHRKESLESEGHLRNHVVITRHNSVCLDIAL